MSGGLCTWGFCPVTSKVSCIATNVEQLRPVYKSSLNYLRLSLLAPIFTKTAHLSISFTLELVSSTCDAGDLKSKLQAPDGTYRYISCQEAER